MYKVYVYVNIKLIISIPDGEVYFKTAVECTATYFVLII